MAMQPCLNILFGLFDQCVLKWMRVKAYFYSYHAGMIYCARRYLVTFKLIHSGISESGRRWTSVYQS